MCVWVCLGAFGWVPCEELSYMEIEFSEARQAQLPVSQMISLNGIWKQLNWRRFILDLDGKGHISKQQKIYCTQKKLLQFQNSIVKTFHHKIQSQYHSSSHNDRWEAVFEVEWFPGCCAGFLGRTKKWEWLHWCHSGLWRPEPESPQSDSIQLQSFLQKASQDSFTSPASDLHEGA